MLLQVTEISLEQPEAAVQCTNLLETDHDHDQQQCQVQVALLKQLLLMQTSSVHPVRTMGSRRNSL